MARRSKKMTRRESEELFYKLCVVIAETDKIDDAARLLRDLLSVTEVEVIAKRIKIAEMLLEGATYKEINKELKTSSSTIFKVQEWLNTSGSGYRKVIKKTRGKNLRDDMPLSTYDSSTWADLKRQLPAYFWPQILLENIIIHSSKKQQARIKTVLRQMDKMEEKNPLYKRIDRIMAGYYRDKKQQRRTNKNNRNVKKN